MLAAAVLAGVALVPAGASASTGTVLMHGLRNAQAYARGGRLFVTEQLNAFGKPPVDELLRVDPKTGQVAAERSLGSAYDGALLADGSLWVSTTRGARSWLWRLDPKSLALGTKLLLGNDGDGSTEAYPTMTVAGGWLWVGYWNELLRVSLKTAKATKVVTGAARARHWSLIRGAWSSVGR
jgi:hypothetical protein